jgi:uncharacterized Zn-finger protein
VRIHSGEFAHRCDTCDKGFHDTYALSRHQRSHTGDRPYRCHWCSKGFVTGSYLKKHLKTHMAANFNNAEQENVPVKKGKKKRKKKAAAQDAPQQQQAEQGQGLQEVQMQEIQNHENVQIGNVQNMHMTMLVPGPDGGTAQVVFVAAPSMNQLTMVAPHEHQMQSVAAR